MIKYGLIFSILPITLISFGQCNRFTDSLALVSLYNATHGADWFNIWDLEQPMSTWYGITLNSEGCVQCIDLDGRLDCDGYLFNDIGNNMIGQIPDSLGILCQIKYISFGNNLLTGSIPSSLSQLQNLLQLILRYNNFTGSIPPTLGDLHDLNVLNLSYNDLSGEIPKELGNLEHLDYLFLFDNDLTGPIPSTFSGIGQLFAFGAAGNRLSGEIPPFLGNLIVQRLDLHDNEFVGCFPEELRSLCDVDVNFSGNISLPWEGDFDQFCNSTSQIGAPCEDGLPNTINFIDTNCDCATTFTSLSEVKNAHIKIYPNPVMDELHIDFEQNNTMTYAIFAKEGQKINSFETNHFDVSDLSPGIYFLEVQNKTTGLRNIARFIKL